jgi:hypothetical protein
MILYGSRVMLFDSIISIYVQLKGEHLLRQDKLVNFGVILYDSRMILCDSRMILYDPMLILNAPVGKKRLQVDIYHSTTRVSLYVYTLFSDCGLLDRNIFELSDYPISD